jgi:predicted mannosyl-3-phosphoglycerate phosphatase (HAD superfamily)
LIDRQEFYETAKDMGVEIIFVSSDETPDDMIAYMKVSRGKAMQWAHLCRKGAYLIAFGEEKKYEK